MTDRSRGGTRPTGDSVRAGAVLLGGVLILCSGLLTLLFGLSTVFHDALLRYGARWVFEFDEPWWGSIHVGLGMVMIVVGFVAMSGAKWTVFAALALALGSTALMFVWTAYYPLWTIPVIFLGLATIGALLIADPTLRRLGRGHSR